MKTKDAAKRVGRAASFLNALVGAAGKNKQLAMQLMAAAKELREVRASLARKAKRRDHDFVVRGFQPSTMSLGFMASRTAQEAA